MKHHTRHLLTGIALSALLINSSHATPSYSEYISDSAKQTYYAHLNFYSEKLDEAEKSVVAALGPQSRAAVMTSISQCSDAMEALYGVLSAATHLAKPAGVGVLADVILTASHAIHCVDTSDQERETAKLIQANHLYNVDQVVRKELSEDAAGRIARSYETLALIATNLKKDADRLAQISNDPNYGAEADAIHARLEVYAEELDAIIGIATLADRALDMLDFETLPNYVMLGNITNLSIALSQNVFSLLAQQEQADPSLNGYFRQALQQRLTDIESEEAALHTYINGFRQRFDSGARKYYWSDAAGNKITQPYSSAVTASEKAVELQQKIYKDFITMENVSSKLGLLARITDSPAPAAWSYIINGFNGELCLDSTFMDNPELQTCRWQRKNRINQTWFHDSHGLIHHATRSSQCLSARLYSTASLPQAGSILEFTDCDANAPLQQFKVNDIDQLVSSANPDLCLSAYPFSSTGAGLVRLEDCDTRGLKQEWRFFTHIKSGVGTCLDNAGWRNDEAITYQCNLHKTNQLWAHDQRGRVITLVNQDFVLEPQYGNVAHGNKLVLSQENGSSMQQWTFNQAVNDSDASIRPKLDDNLCMDISGGQTSNGGKLILWGCHGMKNQQWY